MNNIESHPCTLQLIKLILSVMNDTAEACKQNFTSRHFVIKTNAKAVSRQRSRQTHMTINIFKWSIL